MQRAIALAESHGADVLLAVGVLALAIGLLAFLPGAFSVDSWLELVTGRLVWQTGLPHHETLTALALGKTWIDQQWLSQLASYGLYRLGGLGLLGLASVGLIAAGLGGAVAGARRLGATPKAVLVVLPSCIWLLAPSREVRTQEFVIPLFVAIVYLLARDSRSPSRRVYWCLPLLVLWANLHGTVTIGAMLVVLRGATLAWERRRQLSRAWRRPLALVLLAPVCMLITPYGPGVLGYLHTMLLGSTVRDSVTEWQPVTTAFIVAWPFFGLAGAAVWAFGRWPGRTTPWEQLALLALAAGSVLVIRNLLFFSLCALTLLPAALGDPRLTRGAPLSAAGPRRVRINLTLLSVTAAALLLAAVSILARPAAGIEFSYQRAGVLIAVERATRTDPRLKVLADVRFADWLLWRDPALAGRVANDARFELLSAGAIGGLQRALGVIGPDWKSGAAGYRLIVLDRRFAAGAVRGFLAEPGSRRLYDDGERVVILRAAAEA